MPYLLLSCLLLSSCMYTKVTRDRAPATAKDVAAMVSSLRSQGIQDPAIYEAACMALGSSKLRLTLFRILEDREIGEISYNGASRTLTVGDLSTKVDDQAIKQAATVLAELVKTGILSIP